MECERKQKNDGGGTTSGKPMLDAGSKKKQRARRCRGSLFTRGGKEHHAKPSRARMIEIGTASLLGCAPRKDREKKRERETLEKKRRRGRRRFIAREPGKRNNSTSSRPPQPRPRSFLLKTKKNTTTTTATSHRRHVQLRRGQPHEAPPRPPHPLARVPLRPREVDGAPPAHAAVGDADRGVPRRRLRQVFEGGHAGQPGRVPDADAAVQHGQRRGGGLPRV